MSEWARHPEEPAGGVEQLFPRKDALRDEAGRELHGAAPSPATPWTAEQRYRWLVATAAEGIWRFALEPPVPLDLPENELALAILEHGRLAECNRAYARHYGFEEPRELLGFSLADMMSGSRDEQFGVVLEFVRSDFRLSDLETLEHDRAGRSSSATTSSASWRTAAWWAAGARGATSRSRSRPRKDYGRARAVSAP